MANKLRRSMHRRCLRAFYHYVSNNPPSSPCLRVTFRQKPNLKWQTLSLQNPETLKLELVFFITFVIKIQRFRN